MNLSLVLLALALRVPHAGVPEDPLKASVPGQALEISLEIPEFAAMEVGSAADPGTRGVHSAGLPDAQSTLLFGTAGEYVWIWVLWRENFPAQSEESLARRLSKANGWTSFTVHEMACFEQRSGDRGLVLQTVYEAHPQTPDYTFTIRVVVANLTAEDIIGGTKGSEKLSREAFSKIVASFRTTGTPDRAAMRLPQEAYAFRDEALGCGPDPVGWARKQCAARTEEWAPQLYLGELARAGDRPDFAAPGFARAVELLEARKDRDEKLDYALARSASGALWVQMQKKNYSAAVPLAQEVIEIARADSTGPFEDLGADATFALACAYAQLKKVDKALESLQQALALRPAWKQRTANEELLKPLRKKKEFEALVGK